MAASAVFPVVHRSDTLDYISPLKMAVSHPHEFRVICPSQHKRQRIDEHIDLVSSLVIMWCGADEVERVRCVRERQERGQDGACREQTYEEDTRVWARDVYLCLGREAWR